MRPLFWIGILLSPGPLNITAQSVPVKVSAHPEQRKVVIPPEQKSHYGWIRQQQIVRTKSGSTGILKIAANGENRSPLATAS